MRIAGKHCKTLIDNSRKMSKTYTTWLLYNLDVGRYRSESFETKEEAVTFRDKCVDPAKLLVVHTLVTPIHTRAGDELRRGAR